MRSDCAGLLLLRPSFSSNAVADVVIASSLPSDLSTHLRELSPTQHHIISEAYWTISMEKDADLLMVAVEYKTFLTNLLRTLSLSTIYRLANLY
jgi:hypothetical protein